MFRSFVAYAGIAAIVLSSMALTGCPRPPQPPALVVTVDDLSTQDPRPALTGDISDPAASISVRVDGGTPHSATNNGDGTWTLPANTIDPLSPGTYTVEATATEGGRTATGAGELTIQQPPRLYISNIAGNRITSYANPSTVNGNIAPDTNLGGAQTQLNQPADIVVDAAGNLLVSNFGSPAITGYDDAATASGNRSPDRNVQGMVTQLGGPTTLAVLHGQDLLFVANIVSDNITVYANASTSSFNGNLAPTRVISSPALNNPFGINFGSGDTLYVANNGGNNVLVFANASTLNGAVAPTRVITSAVFANIYDVFLDQANDRLLVVNAGGNINVFNNASTLNGTVGPDFTLTIPGAGFLTSVVVDSNGVGYVVDNTASAVYSYNNIASLNGTLAPNRTISGGNTQLNAPIRVFLDE